MRNILVPLFTASFLIFYTSVHTEEAIRENILGSWEGPLVIGRDNMKLAFTFTLQGEEIALIDPSQEGSGIRDKFRRLMQTKIF